MTRTAHMLGVLTACLLLVATVLTPVQGATTITVAYRATEGPWIEWLQEEFNSRHSDVQVEVLPGLGGWETVEVLATWWLGDVFPDVFFGTGGDVQKYIFNGWTADLTDYINRDRDELQIDDFFPGSIDVWTFDGKIYGLPIGVSGQTVLYNRDLLAQAGLPEPPHSWDTDDWSWDDMMSYARRMTQRDAEGMATRFGTTLRSGGAMIDINWVFGGEYLTPTSYEPGAKWESALFSPENLRAYQAVLDVFYSERIAPNPTDRPGWAGAAGSLLDGRLGMDWTGWWSLTSIVRADTSHSFGLAPPPKVVDRKATLFNDPWFMSSKTPHPEAAWTFIKFATSPEALIKYSEFTGTPPARHSSFVEGYTPSFAEQLGLPPTVLLESFMGSVNYGVYRHAAPDMGVDPFITPYLIDIVKQETALQAGLEEAHRQLTRFLAEQQEYFESR